MELSQSFRVVGGTAIEEIIVENIDGQNVIFLEDIQDVFPEVQHIKNGSQTVNKLRSSDGKRLEPYRIRHYPGVILGVVLSNKADRASTPEEYSDQGQAGKLAASPIAQITSAAAHEDFFFSLMSRCPSSALFASSGSSAPSPPALAADKLSMTKVKARVSLVAPPTKNTVEPNKTRLSEELSKADKILVTNNAASTTPPVVTITTATDRSRLLQSMADRVERMNEATARIRKMVIQADRPTLIREKVEAIFTQSCDFDRNAPRFFIVLPEAPVLWNPETMVQTRFRLYFICACGEHATSTRCASENWVSRMLHVPCHQGYIVKNPTSIFRKHGPFLMVALETLKESLAIAGTNSPFATSFGTAASERIEYSLKYLEEIRFRQLGDEGIEAQSRAGYESLCSYLAGVEIWDKASLDQLGSHLVPSGSDSFLGDMFRMVTEDGKFKWVCRDKY